MTALSTSDSARTIVEDDSVALSVPADPSFLGLLRSTSAHVASKLDLTIEEIDEIRMAVDEAANVLLSSTVGPSISMRLSLGDELVIELSTPSDGGEPDRDGLAWVVLSALTDSVEFVAGPETLALTLTKTRTEA